MYKSQPYSSQGLPPLPTHGPPQAVNNNYQPPISQPDHLAPTPPERKSSYEVTTQYDQGSSAPNTRSTMRVPEPQFSGGKKSVSFNAVATQIEYKRQIDSTSSDGSQYHVQQGGYGGYAPRGVDQPPTPFQRPNYGPDTTTSPPSDVFPSGQPRTPDIRSPENPPTFVTGNTPGVVGAQEVYRDPRDRIAAQRGGPPLKGPGNAERMSFRDKMKMFAHEAGEHTPQEKPKISSAQRTIETGIIAR